MRKTILPLLVIALYGCSSAQDNKQDTPAPSAVSYHKSDLVKIKWIEGKWRGMDKDKPFYEIYRFLNDSTIETLSYEWDGKDSSNTTSSLLSFKDGIYYLGEDQNWKVDSISETAIKMLPNKNAFNDILWRFKDSLHWEAILVSQRGSRTYQMEHFDPFNK